MIAIKYGIIFVIFILCFFIGNIISQKYVERLKELKDFKNALNLIENKINFTYEPLQIVFEDISKMVCTNVSNIFVQAKENMKTQNAEEAWNNALKTKYTNLLSEDIDSIKNFGKMLGKTDKEGQISCLKVTKSFLDIQIEKAKEEENKNSKIFKKLGTIIGLVFVIILI